MKLKINNEEVTEDYKKTVDVDFWSIFWTYVKVKIAFNIIVVGIVLLMGLLLNLGA